MKRRFAFIVLFVHLLVIYAQDNTIVLMQSELPYSNQTWFYSGYGNELQKNKIKDCWDEDKYITSAAYTKKGWLVTMAEDCGYYGQTYFYSSNEPGDWIKDKWDEDYYITTVAANKYKWLIVMSEGTGYTGQTYKNSSSWSKLENWISKNWEEGYFITQASYTGKSWFVVMSKTTEYVRQGYFWANSDSELSSKANGIWKDDYDITLIEYGDGEYFAVFSKFKDGKNITQSFNNDFSDVEGFVQENWNKSMDIAYIGGGYEKSSNTNSFVGNVGGQTLTGGYFISPIYCPPLNTQAIQQGAQMAQQQAAWNAQQTMKYLEEGKKMIEAQVDYNIKNGINPVVVNYSSSDNTGKTTYNQRENNTSSHKIQYGYKDCTNCRGSGKCSSCNGSGIQDHMRGTLCGVCANHKGKCKWCSGSGKRYGPL